MKKNQNIEAMLYNVKIAEETHPIKMVPIYKMYTKGDPRMFLRSALDYIWFDDFQIPNVNFCTTGAYEWMMRYKK